MTTVASTDFVFDRLDGPGGLYIWLDGNNKITAGNGSFNAPQPNAFSLLDRVDCPMRTPTCERLCYVQHLEKHRPDVHAIYAHNSRTIREILDLPSVIEWPRAWARNLAKWIESNASGGFRWHVSGDIFSVAYARWIAWVLGYSFSVRHWIYTRSFHLLEPLLPFSTVRGGNLVINLSADRDNYWIARRMADEHGLRVCYLTTGPDGEVPSDLRERDVIFPDYNLRGVGQMPHAYRQGSDWWQRLTSAERRMVCPTDAYGKSEQVRCGPCRKCLE